MGGPAVAWRPGRTDAADGSTCPPDGRLPNADMGQAGKTVQHLRDIFHRMGFTDQEIVALSGAHALGRCHTDRSGYVGPWTRAETTFSNEYFRGAGGIPSFLGKHGTVSMRRKMLGKQPALP
jgi:cytochrome c peroxidase